MSNHHNFDSTGDVLAYLADVDLLSSIAASPADIAVREVSDGNMNKVFIVSGPHGSRALKYAPPYINIVGETAPIDPARIFKEGAAYSIFAKACPGGTPDIYLLDRDNHTMVMQDLSEYRVLRAALADELVGSGDGAESPVPNRAIAEAVGSFVGRVAQATCRETLGSPAFEELAENSANPELCAITVEYVLTRPFAGADDNRWEPAIGAQVQALRTDGEIKAAAELLKGILLCQPDSFIHGDLHTGSIMISVAGANVDTKIFDPEFGFVGPIGMDLGLYWANMAIAAACARAMHADALAADRANAIATSWQHFRHAAPSFSQASALARIEAEAYGFAGAEMFRRLIGVARAADLERLPAEARALAAVEIFGQAHDFMRRVLIREP